MYQNWKADEAAQKFIGKVLHDGTIRYVYAQIGTDWHPGYQGERVNIDWIQINQKYIVNRTAKTSTSALPPPSGASPLQGAHDGSYSKAALDHYTNTLQEFCSCKYII